MEELEMIEIRTNYDVFKGGRGRKKVLNKALASVLVFAVVVVSFVSINFLLSKYFGLFKYASTAKPEMIATLSLIFMSLGFLAYLLSIGRPKGR
jgi:uncharacterized membrane protein YozB (DUF420 family)